MKGKNYTPCIVAITAGFALTFSACRDASSEPKPLLPVHVANVEMVRSDSAVRYSANIVPYAQVDLAFKSGGYVKSIPRSRVQTASRGTLMQEIGSPKARFSL